MTYHNVVQSAVFELNQTEVSYYAFSTQPRHIYIITHRISSVIVARLSPGQARDLFQAE